MLYQQTMLDSTIRPIAPTLIQSANNSNTKQRQSRSVMFSSSTKTSSASSSQERPSFNKKRRSNASSHVPIPDAMFRSPSELQLSVDEQMADERDFVFYARLVSGIRERTRASQVNQQHHQSYNINEETERCLTHIIQTRHQQEQEMEHDGVPILRDEETLAGGYYLEDLDSSSYSSSSTYQQDFEQDNRNYNDDAMYCEENECIFDLEL